ncbi:MAG: dienelactone hydrolase family protein [Alphaproteobacteria bacterium]|nr:dienelactone hydrolase family protein [Alphaproteobacteria bacterium]
MMRTSITAAVVLAATPALAGETVRYEVDGTAYEGYLAQPAGAPAGLVLVIHDWDGLGAYEERRADMLAQLGYAAFAADLYGAGNRPQATAAKKAETAALYDDREAMRARILGGLATARGQVGDLPAVVMGYCFGGAATLELARSGAADDVVAYTTFHGGLATPEGQSWEGVEAFVLVAHGGADGAITLDDVAQLGRELEAAETAYEIQIYSGAPHAFTVFGSDRYRERADRQSWNAFTDLLAERLGG